MDWLTLGWIDGAYKCPIKILYELYDILCSFILSLFHPIGCLLGPGKQKTVVLIQVILRLSVEHVGLAQAIVQIAQLVRRRAWVVFVLNSSEFYHIYPIHV